MRILLDTSEITGKNIGQPYNFKHNVHVDVDANGLVVSKNKRNKKNKKIKEIQSL